MLGIGFIVLGMLLIAGSRLIADGFAVPGDPSRATKLLGLGDDPGSRLLRWTTAVLTGVVFVAAGVAVLVGG